MKYFEFQIALPSNSTRTFLFYDEDRAKEKLSEYVGMDPRFDPTTLKEHESDDPSIVVDENNRFVEHDLRGLTFIGNRTAEAAGATRKEKWYSKPGFENDVKQRLEKAMQAPNTVSYDKAVARLRRKTWKESLGLSSR